MCSSKRAGGHGGRVSPAWRAGSVSSGAPAPRRRSARAQDRDEEVRQWEELVPHLPEGARQLWAALDDLDRFKRVLMTYGGRTLRIPASVPPPGHRLRQSLGAACTERLVARYGGTELYVPTCRAVLGRLRQQEIIRDFSRAAGRGMSSVNAVAALAGRYGLSDRRIWQILKTTASAPRGAKALRRLTQGAPERAEN
ncbi:MULTISPECIES: Mor transcription activator family protein [unclassified Desulfovibrio]|uniref:Mor transcription activator family protein n=1 Tax=unclassified Desulfovibrio TaxID=2593640 RepID=UPI0013EA7527|nr:MULTISPECIES: Mor transcription activator family protein [unclassified Desulfovibrio]